MFDQLVSRHQLRQIEILTAWLRRAEAQWLADLQVQMLKHEPFANSDGNGRANVGASGVSIWDECRETPTPPVRHQNTAISGR